MSENRAVVLLFLLVLTAMEFAGVGCTIWHVGGDPSPQYDYGVGAIVALGWLAYFGSRA